VGGFVRHLPPVKLKVRCAEHLRSLKDHLHHVLIALQARGLDGVSTQIE
jgi:plasmid stability protein